MLMSARTVSPPNMIAKIIPALTPPEI